jgi:putative transposase
MKYNPLLHQRRSIRLAGYNYTQHGEYFVTILTHERECMLGSIENEEVMLTEIGKIVNEEWLRTPAVRKNVELDEFVIMPNHVHGIIIIQDDRKGVDAFVGAYGNTPLREIDSPPGKTPFRSPSRTIGAIIRGFKAASTKRINALRRTPGAPVWQRNYYEHVIRDEKDLEGVREYIAMNPSRWDVDDEFAHNIGMDPIHAG